MHRMGGLGHLMGGLGLLLLSSVLQETVAGDDSWKTLACKQLGLTIKPILSGVALANILKRCLECKRCQLDPSDQTRLETMKQNLPLSIKNAVFLRDVCIKNTRFNEYLYPPESGFSYDKVKRRVFTWIPGNWDHSGKGDWKFMPNIINSFSIESTNHNEYLFVDRDANIVKLRRPVFTTSPEWEYVNEEKALWELEPTGDNVYIKNFHNDEYLYAVDGLNYDKDRRSVVTWHDSTGCIGDSQCIWKIESC